MNKYQGLNREIEVDEPITRRVLELMPDHPKVWRVA